MPVLVNNKEHELLAGDTVQELLRRININDERGIAVALNNQVLSKSEWPSTLLAEKDKLTIIKATQGG